VSDPGSPPGARRRFGHSLNRLGSGAPLPLYALALFLSALLAFWIQPLFAKLVLPRYGGSPAVWTTASLFFQLMLLAGYLYAHVIARLPLRTQLVLHVLLVAAALTSLPVNVAALDAGTLTPVASLLAVLALSLGLAFFALSATAPLLQQWFSRSGHSHAQDPYFLYSASNAGSLGALVGYPLLLEPLLGLRQQTLLWSTGCAAFGGLLLVCGAGVWRNIAASAAAANTPAVAARAEPLSWRVRGRWILLALAPSSLMLGVTQHITSEIAAAPLLWLIPLTLYVLTFVLAFARRQWIPAAAIDRVQPALVVLLALVWPLNHFTSVLGLHLLVFAVTAMMCHAELARTRPPVEHLTAFYLCIAVGGAAGGVFNALIAPFVFDSVLEYPLALALACALRKAPAAGPLWKTLIPPFALAAGFAALYTTGFHSFAHTLSAIVYLQVIGVTLYVTHRIPVQFALTLLVVLLATPIVHSAERLLERHRSFFGVHSVLLDETGRFHVLMHGVTIHGAQRIDAERKLTPTTYYHPDSPVARLLDVLGRNDALRRVAVVGLGVGTLACHRAANRVWTFYEIDPVVVSIAKNPRYFSFLSGCAPGAPIVLGDGRLSLAGAPAGAYDIIIIDSFASDAIPVHLVTREALALYLSRLSERGIVLFQVTTQHMDLVPVLARLAADAKVAALMPGPRFAMPFEERLATLPSMWVAIARQPARLAPLIDEENWMPLPQPPPGRV
jgi:spermidine synthase